MPASSSSPTTHRAGDFRRLLPLGRLLLFDPDFLIQRVLQLVRGALEFVQASSQGTPQLGQLARPEDDQGDHHDDDELGHADGTEHNGKSLKNRAVVRRTHDYRNGPRKGQPQTLSGPPKSLQLRHFVCYDALTCVLPGSSPWRSWRWCFRRWPAARLAAACMARQDEVAQPVQDLHVGARRDREGVRRRTAGGPPRLRRHRRHAEAARSAFELLRPAQLPPAARAPVGQATTASASRFSRSTATSR